MVSFPEAGDSFLEELESRQHSASKRLLGLGERGRPRLVALAVLRSDLNGGEHADGGPE